MIAFYILIIIALVLFCVRKWKFSPEQKGIKGERDVHRILSKLPEEYHVMDDVVLKKGQSTTQIDHIVVSKYGIFAIETKNYRGDIYGNDASQQWTQIIKTDVTYMRKWYKTYTYITKNRFYNPVKQSMGHVNGIKTNLSGCPYVPIIPIVVFTGGANLASVQSSVAVVDEMDLLYTIRNHHQAYLSDSQVHQVIECLSRKNVRGAVDEKTHVRNVLDAKEKYQEKIESGICPECGGRLVPRNGRYGFFYGCSNYPRCRFKYSNH